MHRTAAYTHNARTGTAGTYKYKPKLEYGKVSLTRPAETLFQNITQIYSQRVTDDADGLDCHVCPAGLYPAEVRPFHIAPIGNFLDRELTFQSQMLDIGSYSCYFILILYQYVTNTKKNNKIFAVQNKMITFATLVSYMTRLRRIKEDC